jgi:hypothetical protein
MKARAAVDEQGFDSHLGHSDPVVQRHDTSPIPARRERSMLQFHLLSIWRRSVGVSVARRLGKAEDRVQFPDEPLTSTKRAAGPMEGHLGRNQKIGVRLPGGPLTTTKWAHGLTE